MENILRALVAQNERMVELLEEISEKLDGLNDIDQPIISLSSSIDSVEVELNGATSDVASILKELQWHEELTFANQVLGRIDQASGTILNR